MLIAITPITTETTDKTDPRNHHGLDHFRRNL
jgi:hypothetical protein